MEIEATKFKRWYYWYDEQGKGKKGEVKTMKEYINRNHEESRSRYCKKAYVKLSEEKKQGQQENKSEQMNYMSKQKDIRKISVTVKNSLKKCLYTETSDPDSC